MAEVRFDEVSKVFKDGTRAVDKLSLDIADGEFMVLVGPSGCGKTTALRMVGGLEEITEGTVWIGERIVNDLSPKSRDIAMVFQSYALYPHLSVADNIGFALKTKRVPKDEIHRRVLETAQMLDLEPYLRRKPRALSGGQRQRVAMGRAIIRQPQAFLMDEPLSNLDAKLRVQMRAEIKKLQSELGVTTVYVTHDQVEAMTMGDRVSVMRKGTLQQVAPPEELYDRPQNMFVAGFIGSPAMSMLDATVSREDGSIRIVAGEMSIELSDETLAARPALQGYAGRAIVLGIRPEGLNDAALAADDHQPRLRGHAELREALGSEVLMHFSVAARAAVTEEVRELAEDVGDDRAIKQLASDERATLVGRFSPATRIREGDTIDVAVEESALHFFDPSTGEAIYDDAADRVALS
jgi:multiple sugar transport system ATP-binding protein